MKTILGILLGVAGMVLLGSIVLEASYLAFASDDLAVRLILSLAGLAMIHLGWRLISGPRAGASPKR